MVIEHWPPLISLDISDHPLHAHLFVVALLTVIEGLLLVSDAFAD